MPDGIGPGRWMGPEGSLGGMPRTGGLRGKDHGENPEAAARQIDSDQLRRVTRWFAPYGRQWAIIFACIATSAALGVLPPLAVRGILDRAIPQGNLPLLYFLVGAIIGLNLVAGLISVLQNYVNALVGEGIVFDLRNALFQHLQKMSLAFYTATRAGEITSRINNDVAAVQGVATATLIAIVSNLLTVVATAVVIFAMDWRLALIAIIVVPCLFFPTRLVGRFRRRLARQTQETQADLLAFLQERLNISGMLLTRIFGQAYADAEVFQGHSRKVMDLNIRQALAGRWLFLCLTVFSVAGPALIYAIGGNQAIQHRLTVGTIIAFVAYLSNLYRPLANLANVYVDIQAALGVFERIFQFLDLKPEVEDRSDALTLSSARGHVRFEHVSFSYPPPKVAASSASDDEPASPPAPHSAALSDLTFDILPGQRVALVGPSGAGKTTITYLLPRFFDPNGGGRVTLDGHDLRELTQESVREHIGMVTQETFLFHATVRENLLYARPNATEAEMIAAAEAAHIHNVIQQLPQGYDTVVGERAFRLSGGERQRLSIARVLLKNPAILVLDEATSSLDATSEYLIQQALETLLQGRTSLIIAHRLSTILNADRILVLDKGRLVESGTHPELLARNGLYAALYRQQFSKVEAAAKTEEGGIAPIRSNSDLVAV